MSVFGDEFRPSSTPSRTRPHSNLAVLRLAVLLLFGVLVVRLVDMQIVKGDDYARRSENNHIVATNILPARGLIYARGGEPLVENAGVYAATIVPEFLPEKQDDRYRIYLWLENNLGVPVLDSQTRVAEAEKNSRPGQAIVMKSHLSREEALVLEEASTDMPGLSLRIVPGRDYIGGEAFAHVLGYIGPQTAEEAKLLREKGYAFNEPVGKAGVESRYEEELRGEIGFSANEQDAHGNLLNVLMTRNATPGNSLRLSLDLDLQQYVAELLEDSLGDAKVAAAVVMSPKTGEVYALVSVPTYDNNLFGDLERRQAEYVALATDDERHPLLNQALTESAPGSTFKLITAAAALEEGNITPSTSLNVTSTVLEFKGENGVIYPLYDWRAHGWIDLIGAIAWSSNHYFYMASCGIQNGGKGLGRNTEESAVILGYYARALGLGKATGIDIDAGEMPGIIPSPEYKRRVHTGPEFNPEDREWYYADTCFMGIGQQDVTATPLQIARMTAAIANGGKLLTPHVVSDVLGPDGAVVKSTHPEYTTVPVDPANLETIRLGMRASVSQGAGSRAAQPGLDIAGKTGTAEFGPEKANGKRDEHAWFTGFAPYNDPEVVVTVYFDLGVGGEKAAPVAGQIFRYFMDHVQP
ncbi:MAG: penicillin-binding protein 2 [Dehalococcoidia bacterium]|nr:penicillin-binding protein 2 [Dehalococcoidia bacterium]